MSPFVVLFFCSLNKIEPSRWFVLPEANIVTDDDDAAGFVPTPAAAGVHWRPLLNMLFWNLNSFDVGASFAGEVRDPERVFPRAMFLSVILTVAGYIIPLATALGAADTRQEDWNAGYFASVAATIAGPWLGIWTVFAAAVSNIALFEAEMSGDAYQLMGMADRGMIPKLFTKRSRFDTPQNGIILNTFVIILMSVANFEELVEMLNFAYSLAFLMEFAAFVKLRIDEPDLERPYRVPLNTFGCILFITPPCIFLICLMLIASKMTYIYCAALCTLGVGFYVFQKFAKHYHLIAYVEEPPKRTKKKRSNAEI
jgi:amino acid transporter